MGFTEPYLQWWTERRRFFLPVQINKTSCRLEHYLSIGQNFGWHVEVVEDDTEENDVCAGFTENRILSAADYCLKVP